MITFEQARRAGIDACIDRLGREFVTKHRETACSAYGDRGDYRCTVSYVDGSIDYLDSVLPSAEESGI